MNRFFDWIFDTRVLTEHERLDMRDELSKLKARNRQINIHEDRLCLEIQTYQNEYCENNEKIRLIEEALK